MHLRFFSVFAILRSLWVILKYEKRRGKKKRRIGKKEEKQEEEEGEK